MADPISFQELSGSPLETFGADGMTAQRRIKVDWADRLAMVRQLVGEDGTYGARQHAQYPGWGAVLAVKVRTEPWIKKADEQTGFTDVETHINTYSGSPNKALLTIDYKYFATDGGMATPPEYETGTYIEYRRDMAGEYQELQNQAYHWDSGIVDANGLFVAVPPGAMQMVRVACDVHQITWHRVVNPPWEAIRRLKGCVNGAAKWGFPAETLLFEGGTSEREFPQLGLLEDQGEINVGWRMTYVFRERCIYKSGANYGWNHVYRSLPSDNPGWDKLIDDNGDYVYRADTDVYAPDAQRQGLDALFRYAL